MVEQPNEQLEQSFDPWAADRATEMERRLYAVGATDDEVQAFLAQWLYEDWEPDEKRRLWALGDGKLRRELDQTRVDALQDTESDDDEADRLVAEKRAVAEALLRHEAEVMSAYRPFEIADWMGNSKQRAKIILDIETPRPDARPEVLAYALKVMESQ